MQPAVCSRAPHNISRPPRELSAADGDDYGMKTPLSLLWSLTITMLGAGCVGAGPNTQQGAVGGAAPGAGAGAIIGNNSRGHDSVGGALLGGLVGAIAGGAIGNSLDHQRGTIYTSEAQATTEYAVATPPRPPAPPREAMIARSAP